IGSGIGILERSSRSPEPRRSLSASRTAVVAGLLLGAITFVMIATLTPVASTAADSSLCLLSCGPRASADAVANLILFVPLGFALGLAGWRPRRVAMTGAAGSLLIELAQFSLIAGRDASLADVLSNAAGA